MAPKSRLKKTPTPEGAELVDLCVEKDGSVSAAARRMDVDPITLWRRIYGDVPARVDSDVKDRMRKYGVPPGLIQRRAS